jgi:hypothetical protein
MKIFWTTLIFLISSLQLFAQSSAESCKGKDFVMSLTKSAVIVIAKVEKANLTLGTWNLNSLSEKMAKYKVLKVLKGKLDSENMFVLFPIGEGIMWVEKEKPKLSTNIFTKGNKKILLVLTNKYPQKELEHENKEILGNNPWFIPVNECNGMLDFNQENENQILNQLKMINNNSQN